MSDERRVFLMFLQEFEWVKGDQVKIDALGIKLGGLAQSALRAPSHKWVQP